MQTSQEIRVQYRDLGGIHVFTATALPGLHHAHHNLRTAFDTLPAVVNELVKRQFGLEPGYRALTPFEELSRAAETLDTPPVVILAPRALVAA